MSKLKLIYYSFFLFARCGIFNEDTPPKEKELVHFAVVDHVISFCAINIIQLLCLDDNLH